MIKKCVQCGQEKEAAGNFYKDGRCSQETLGGYRQPCIPCTTDDRRFYQQSYVQTPSGQASKKLSNKRAYRKNHTNR